ncbi:hypothetical protein GCM10010505_35880 [Kitasatospora aburaviensis]
MGGQVASEETIAGKPSGWCAVDHPPPPPDGAAAVPHRCRRPGQAEGIDIVTSPATGCPRARSPKSRQVQRRA